MKSGFIGCKYGAGEQPKLDKNVASSGKTIRGNTFDFKSLNNITAYWLFFI